MKYPFQDEIDETFIEYSKSKKKFKPFVNSEVSLNMKERAEFIRKHLKIKKVILIKK
jgi:hypothetical protein